MNIDSEEIPSPSRPIATMDEHPRRFSVVGTQVVDRFCKRGGTLVDVSRAQVV